MLISCRSGRRRSRSLRFVHIYILLRGVLTRIDVLGITTGATKIEIKKAYHKVCEPWL